MSELLDVATTTKAERLRKPRSEEHCRKLSEALKGKTLTAEHRDNIGKAGRGRPHSAEHRRRIAEALKGVPLTPERRRNISEAKKRKGRTLSEEHIRRLNDSRSNNTSSLERFIKACLVAHEVKFTHQGHIPGFAKLAGRSHPWDFTLPEKKLAVELDGSYWHQPRPKMDFAWDCSKEAEDELVANLLGWRVVRIPEKVLRESKPFRVWLRLEKAARKKSIHHESRL